jgi:hypothetical protein
MLILGSVIVGAFGAPTGSAASGYDRLAQAPAPTVAAPPSPPVATTPAGPNTPPQPADNPIGSVATLQGSASVTRNDTASALKVRDTIFKGDRLQTGTDGTLGISFDDETTFTLKPNSGIAVNDFVYQSGGAHNAAVFNIYHGTVAFLASQVAKTGDMKIEASMATIGIRGTTGIVELAESGGTTAPVVIKLYPDADGRVGRIEVFGRDGTQLGILSRGASGFAIRPGAPGAPLQFTAVPLQISAQEAERDRSFVRQAVSAQLLGRQMNIQRRNQQPPQTPLPRSRPRRLPPPGARPKRALLLPDSPPGIPTLAQPLPNTLPPDVPTLQPSPGILPPVAPPYVPTPQPLPGGVPPFTQPGLPGLPTLRR